MRRDEATNLVKEIVAKCDVSLDAIMIMPSDSDGRLSHGFQLHIKSSAVQQDLPSIKSIVEKHDLTVFFEKSKGLLIIYKPIEKNEVAATNGVTQ